MSQASIIQCRDCAFWDGAGGAASCRRYAPDASFTQFEVARWAETRATDGCGEGEAASDASSPRRQQCEGCVFWYRPGIGIDPGNRGDHFRAWWQRAGYCRRHAPRPGGSIGETAFWRATHSDDYCFEGRPR